MKIDQNIFRTYDIRGIYPEQINEDAAYALGRAYATLFLKKLGQEKSYAEKKQIAVGNDMRISGGSLKKQVIAGLLDSGLDVVDIGMNSTPTFYYAVAKYGFSGGLQVSASHNPKEWNGLKIVRQNAVAMSKDTGIFDLRDIILNDAFVAKAEKQGELTKLDVDLAKQEAEEQLKWSAVNPSEIKPFKIVIDAANAMGGVDMSALFSSLPCEIVKMNYNLDGTFPAHPADPMISDNTKDLRERIVAEKADLGIAPDGDGDRIFFFDEKGELLPQSVLRGIMAQIALRENPGAIVCYDIRPGRITADMIKETGGNGVVTPVGHSIIKSEMIKVGAVFGGESSGHYFYKLPYGTFEAPMVLVAKFLKYLSDQDKTFSEAIEPFKKYFNSGEINTPVSDRIVEENRIEEIKNKFSDGQQSFIDGLSVEYPDYWFNVRPSNTEPVLRLTVEAVSLEKMESVRDDLLQIIQHS